MTPVRRIGKNLAFKTLTELIGRVLSFVFYIFLARWLGDAAFGAFSLLYSVTAVVVFLVDPGLNTLLIRQTPRDPAFLQKSTGALFGLKLVLSVATVAVSMVYAALAGYGPEMMTLMALMGAQMAAFALTEYFSAIFQAREKMELETLIMGAGKVVVTGCAIGAVVAGADLAWTVAAMTAAQVAVAGWSARWTAGRGVSLRPQWSAGLWAGFLTTSIPLAAVTFFTIAFYRIDVIIAPFLGLTFQQIGWYSAGVKILDVALAVPTLVMAAAFPTLSGLAGSDYPRFRSMTNRAIIALGAAGAAMGAVISLLSFELVTGIFGKNFAPAAAALGVLGVAAFLMYLRHGLVIALIIDRRHAAAAWLAAVALPLNIVLNAALVPAAGITGAALAKLMTDLLLVGAAGLYWRRSG